MTIYGIYLAYPPTANLLIEGLGRYLIEFLKQAQIKKNIYFVIACPSWMRDSLIKIFDEAEIRPDCYEIIGPKKKPILLTLYSKYLELVKRPRFIKKFRWKSLFKTHKQRIYAKFAKKIVTARYATPYFLLIALTLPILFVFLFLYKLIKLCMGFLRSLAVNSLLFLKRQLKIEKYLIRISHLTLNLHSNSIVENLYQLMHDAETSLMITMINSRKDVKAWYCPTAFWPSFNAIKAPSVICVPDVVLTHFPVGFSEAGGDRYLETFRKVEETIKTGSYFVTYSEEIKWQTLIRRYHINPSNVAVVRHGANRLDELISMNGFGDGKAMTKAFCQSLLQDAFNKAIDGGGIYKNKVHLSDKQDMEFLFYASQFRPNKNILTLLRAYKYLLKERYFQLKLILTGDPNTLPSAQAFIKEHNLENDVLCLHGLSNKELAACYYLAQLAVNPSFSEGGCPFTFTEALSVGTPVVMARISVTEEVITCPDLQEQMLFDPYDWMDLANRIEWGLQNRELLLTKQKQYYTKLAERTWLNVVDDYLHILDSISAKDNTDLEQFTLPQLQEKMVDYA